MRPLRHPSFGGALVAGGAAVLATAGPYCATCERPLPLELGVLDTATGVVLDPDVAHPDPARTLAICHDCAAAHARSGTALEGVLLPHRDATFAVGPGSPLRYVRTEVPALVTDADGVPALGSETVRPFVVVAAATDAGAATVAHFALNTRYWDGAGLRIPAGENAADYDARGDLRTAAWEQAERCVRYLGGDAVRDADPGLADVVRDIAAATGFWSVFATVFWRAWADADVVGGLLRATVPGRPAVRLAPPESYTGLLDRRFPGTREDWLPG